MNIEILSLVLQVALLVGMSAICSGLNIALMSLNVADLRRQAKIGSKQAKKVLPYRKNSHLSLAAILFTNVAVISASSLVLEHHLYGLIAGLISTLLIVIFGEVIPQALFVKNALGLCAFFAPLLKTMIIITYPVSKPLQMLLDKMFGKGSDRLHSRQELTLIMGEHLVSNKSELDEDEVEIIQGALQLSEKQVESIMTPIKYVYSLTNETVIDGDRIDEIKARGWSRIPIISKNRRKCYGILLQKDLVDIDFDEDPINLKTHKLHPTKTVGAKTALDTMFRHFISTHGHMMIVEKKGVIIGIVTIEDLIEEILGHEIEDETIHNMAKV